MDGIDAVGEVVTGGLVARAVEPQAGEGDPDGHTHEKSCLNCGKRLTGAYCSACGQKAHVHRSLAAFGQDFLSGALNFEGKIFKTLPLLTWQPGNLTRRYIDGERARFVSPLALFLFSVFLLFATIQSVGGSGGMDELTVGNQAYHSTTEALAGERAKLARLLAKRSGADPEDIQELDRRIADQRKSVATLERFQREGVVNAVLADKDTVNARSTVPIVNAAIQRARANPQLALYRLQDAASKFAWALIPISVPFLWLLFPFSRRFSLYDHTVFVTYSLSFVMLLIVIVSLCGALGISEAVIPATLILPVHIYRQLKGAYALRRFGALWRTVLLLIFAVIALSLFAMAVIVLGMSG